MAALLPLGIFAGILTTVSGLGGGMMLVLVLSWMWDPHMALAATAPALMVGNAHRVAIFRRQVDWRVAGTLVLGALPGSLLGGLVAAWMPPTAIKVTLLAMTALAVSKELGWVRFSPGPRWLVPVGFVMGAVSAVGSGAGLILAPLLLAAGLRGERYVATGAAVALTMHVGRLVAYGAGGLVTRETLLASVLIGAAILVGNLAGVRVRTRLSERGSTRIAYGVLVACVVLALAGLTSG